MKPLALYCFPIDVSEFRRQGEENKKRGGPNGSGLSMFHQVYVFNRFYVSGPDQIGSTQIWSIAIPNWEFPCESDYDYCYTCRVWCWDVRIISCLFNHIFIHLQATETHASIPVTPLGYETNFKQIQFFIVTTLKSSILITPSYYRIREKKVYCLKHDIKT